MTAWSGSGQPYVKEVKSYLFMLLVLPVVGMSGAGTVKLVFMGAEFQLGREKSSGGECGDGGQHKR